MGQVVSLIPWEVLTLIEVFHCMPDSAWADG